MALDSFIFGGNTGLTYEQLKRRRAVALALASQRRGYPKTIGEGLTYLGESIGDTLAERRLDAAERQSAAYGANLRRDIEGGAAAPSAAPSAAPLAIPPAAPRAPAPVRPPAAPMPPRPAPAAPPISAAAPILPEGPSSAAMTSGPPPGEFGMGGILNAAPLAAPNLEPVFPGEEGIPSQAAGILPSSGYLPPAATAAAPPPNLPAPTAAPSALGPQSSVAPPDAGDTPPNVLAQAQQVALQGGPAAVSRFMADAGYPKSGAWCGQFAAAVASSAGVQPPAGPAVASNWRNVGTPVDTPQVGDVAIARPGWAPRRGSGETGQTGSHVTFVNQADPAGTFQGLGGSQGRMVRPFNARDFEFRRLPGEVQGHRIIGIPGEEPAEVQVAAYAPAGGISDAPVPGMGSAGAPRLQPQIPPLQGPPPAPEEQVTPTDIEPAPPTAQFGPPAGRFTRSDAPVVGLPPAAAAPAPGMAGPTQQAPPVPAIAPRPSQEPIPPATPQIMEPPSATPPPPPTGRPMTDTQQKILRALTDPRLDGPNAAALKDMFSRHEAERQRLEKIDFSDYTSKRERWEKQTTDYEKFVRERTEREIKQLGERQAIEEQRQKMEEGRQKLKAGQAPTHATVNDVPVQWDQESGTWKEIKVQRLPSEGGPPSVKLTKEQSDELQHLTKVRIALDQYNRVRDADKILAEGLKDELAGRLPFFGNAALSEKYRAVRNAASNFLQGHLRSTSGAAIGAQEMATHYSSLVPLYGDDPVTIKNKQQQREGIAQGMYVGLGTARPLFDYTVQKRQEEDTAEQARLRAEMPKNPEVGKIYKNEKGRRRYWTGSRWEDD